MKTINHLFFCLLFIASPVLLLGQTPFASANASAEVAMKKMKYDFPKELINSKNGGGYSLRTELLDNKVEKVALVTFFLEDVGMSSESEMLNLANAWRTSDALAQSFANSFYQKGISSLQSSFKEGGIDLLLPEQYLNTPEKKAYYSNYTVEHMPLKKEKTKGASASVSQTSSTNLGGGWVSTSTKTISASVNRIKVVPEGTDYKVLFFLNEAPYTKGFKGDPLPMSMPTIGLYDKKQANSMGFDLCKKLEVDAVLAVYIVINKMKKNKEIYAVRSISGYMWGPNPIQREEGKDKGLIYTKGIFYCGARAFYGSGLIFKDEKKYPTPDFTGIDQALAAMGKRITHYLNTGKRK